MWFFCINRLLTHPKRQFGRLLPKKVENPKLLDLIEAAHYKGSLQRLWRTIVIRELLNLVSWSPPSPVWAVRTPEKIRYFCFANRLELDNAGRKPCKLKLIMLTHGDADHVGMPIFFVTSIPARLLCTALNQEWFKKAT